MSQYNTIPSQTTYDAYSYRPGDLKQDDTSRAGVSDFKNAINIAYEHMMTGTFTTSDLKMAGIGIIQEPRLKEEDATMKYLMRAVEATSTDPNEFASRSNVGSMLSGMPALGPRVEFLPVNNGDQYRKFGQLMSYGVTDAAFRTSIRSYNLEKDQSENGGDGVVIAEPERDAGDPNVYTTTLYLGPDQTEAMCQSGCSCAPGANDCAAGYRVLYIIKKAEFGINRTTTREMALVKEYEYNPLGDGGSKVVLQRGFGRTSVSAVDQADPNTFVFEEGMPVVLDAGDVILWGPVITATDCLPKVECCQAHPSVQVYCSTTQEFVGCVYTDQPGRRMIQRRAVQNANGTSVLDLPSAYKEAFEIQQNMRNSIHQIYNAIMYSPGETYDAGKPMPVLNEGSLVEDDCKVIPNTLNGIFPTIDKYGRKLSHHVGGQADTCGQYNINRLFEIMGNDIPEDAVIFGDVRPLAQYAAAFDTERVGNIIPNTVSEARKYDNMQGSTYMAGNTKIKSIFGENFNTEGLEISTICLGTKEMIFVHDSTMAKIEPGKFYILRSDLTGITFFAPDIQTINENSLGFSPYLPATGEPGQLKPVV